MVNNLQYNRKYAIQVLNRARLKSVNKRTRPLKYRASLPVILKVWQALDYICAERLHPVLLETAELLAKHQEIELTEEHWQHLSSISRATLARMLKSSRQVRRKRTTWPKKASYIKSQIPIKSYEWQEKRPGALEIDLVEHNGGSSIGHFAYTLSVVDVVTGYSRRRAVLGRGQIGVHKEVKRIVFEWPYAIWGIHTDNGSEFLSAHVLKYCEQNCFQFTRSRPYKKNDSPHVEQKNFQHVRCLVGYERFDTLEQVDWLNTLYEQYDRYVNLFQPSRKLVSKERHGSRVKKGYDTAKTPLKRALEAGVVAKETADKYQKLYHSLNPLKLHQQVEQLLTQRFTTNTEVTPLEKKRVGTD